MSLSQEEIAGENGYVAAQDLIVAIQNIAPTDFDSLCAIGNDYIAAWHESFMAVWMPWMAQRTQKQSS
jgi:hypothetical protein